MKKYALSLLSILLFTLFTPVSAHASQVCNGSECVVTFGYSGTHQQWAVPQGATNIRFFVYGASGARGGAGGSVTGQFTSVPSTLYIFVGGQGSQGRNASGGFNGGGDAGGNRGNEGSGGGGSDIRTSLNLAARIVVAGGGGGGGGYSGAAGAAGGGLEAPAGGWGQGGGGGGGTQTAGGAAGFPNGGSPATAGTFGQGGTGGSSWNAGGGGGGGGWYGGGGGGGDDNDCCADGGGGGGGSSYASTNHTSNVNHAVGVNSGHGRIEIHFTLVPVVLSFTGSQVSSTSAIFEIQISENIVGLSESDLLVSGCQLATLSVAGAVANITVNGCVDGIVTLSLSANSIGASQNGPPESVQHQIEFDATAPIFVWNEAIVSYSYSPIVISFSVTDAVIDSLEYFELGNCGAELIENGLSLSDCSLGANIISLKPMVLVDQWGNAGPISPISFSFNFDNLAPQATWSNVETIGDGPFTYSAVLNFSEAVNFSTELILFVSTSDCSTGHSVEDYGWIFWAECSYGSGSWTLPALSASDLLGNLGPLEEATVFFENPEPIVTPEAIDEPAESSHSESVGSTPNPEAPANPEPAPTSPTPAAVDNEVVQTPVPVESADPISEPETSAPETETAEEIGSEELEPVIEEASDPESIETAAAEAQGYDSEPSVIVATNSTIEKASRSKKVEEVIEAEEVAVEEIFQLESTQSSLSEIDAFSDTKLASGSFDGESERDFPLLPLGLAMIGILVLAAVAFRLSGR